MISKQLTAFLGMLSVSEGTSTSKYTKNNGYDVIDLGKQGMTMIVVTHEMGFAKKVADRVIFLDSGKIVEENTSEAFFDAPKSDRAQDFLSKVFYD